MAREQTEPIERVLKRTDKTSDCWLWTGGANGHGYGHIKISGKMVYVHRISYEHFVGKIPEGLVIDHLCRVPRCVNPEHLEAVTSAENTRRGQAPTVIASKRGTCPKGHKYSYRNNIGTQRCRICDRETWKKSKRKLRKEKNDGRQNSLSNYQ